MTCKDCFHYEVCEGNIERDNVACTLFFKDKNIIQKYKHAYFMIAETLVDESKCHITAEKAIQKIRKYLCELHN